jgi:hypothetical protein
VQISLELPLVKFTVPAVLLIVKFTVICFSSSNLLFLQFNNWLKLYNDASKHMTLLQMHGRNPEPSKSEKEQAPWAVRYYEARTMDRGQDEQQKTSQWTVKRLTQLLFPCEVAHGLACEDGARRCGTHNTRRRTHAAQAPFFFNFLGVAFFFR